MMGDAPDGDDLEGRKTRYVSRSDIVDGEAPKTAAVNRLGQSPQAMPADNSASPAGTVIGRTRLVGLGSHDVPGGAAAPATATPHAPTMQMKSGAPAGKTEFLRADSTPVEPVVGWVVIVLGPGRGSYRPVYVGMNSVGRDPSQRICLDFGDETISREQHAYITYDDEQRRYWVQNGGKSNLVRLGTEVLAAPAELKGNDEIRIGKTVLRFYRVCGPEFSWTDEVSEA